MSILNVNKALTVWQEIVQIADENYEPGKFTTFPAYEWTSQGPMGTQNLHRKVH